jgi:hypothetical protein
MVLAAMAEAGLAVAASPAGPAEREHARELLLRMLAGFGSPAGAGLREHVTKGFPGSSSSSLELTP